jgi:hypothetical protein
MLPWLKGMQERHAFTEYVPMSATREADVERLFGIVEKHLPEQPWFYEEDALTDRSDRFLASEMIREKLFRLTGDELPYTSTVVIDKYEEEGNLRRISADHRRRARRPQGHGHRRGRRAAQAHRQRGAPGARAAAARPRSSSSCGSRCAPAGPTTRAPAQLRLRVTWRRGAPAPPPRCGLCAAPATTGARPA